MSLNVIFAGTPEFSAVALKALVQSNHNIVAVYTQPDRPAGRGRKLTPSAVKAVALEQGLPVFQPETLRDANEQQKLRELNADVMVVVAYGLLLPEAVLKAPKFGCINIHGSLLPRWRGAAPIQRAILAGDAQTGVTIMQMDVGLDTGPMLNIVKCSITDSDTSVTLYEKLAAEGAQAMLQTLQQIENGTLKSEVQDNQLATYAHKIKKEEGKLDWHKSAEELERQVRAFNPWPVAFLMLNEQPIRVWEAKIFPVNEKHEPGTIVNFSEEGVHVATATNGLLLKQIQFPGGRTVSAHDVFYSTRKDFVVGNKLD